MFAIALLAASVFVNYGDTPAHAILQALFAPKGSHVIVERVNVVGRYATVLSRGALAEGSPVNESILVERFSFGWQAIEYANFRCRLDAHALSKREQRSLLLGMPQPQEDRPCKGFRELDFGPKKEVEEIRRVMRGPMIPKVAVADNFALGHWYGAGGGETLYRKVGTHWHVAAGGGGAMGTSDLRALGVPAKDWCALGVYDAKCGTAH